MLGTRAEGSEAEHEESERGRQRHGNVAGHAVELAHAVRVPEHGRQGDREGRQDDELGRPVAAPRLPVEEAERRPEEQEAEAGVGRDPVAPEPVTEEHLVQPEVGSDRVPGQRDGADDGHEGGRHPCGATELGTPGGRGRQGQPQGDRRQHEAERRQGIHGDAARQDAREDGDVELPSDEDRPASHEAEHACRPRHDREPRAPARADPGVMARRQSRGPTAFRHLRHGGRTRVAAARCARASARATAGTAWSGSRSPPPRSRPRCSRRPPGP